MKYSGIGGQAVIEGIMMMNGNDYAIAVRKPDGDIEVKKDTYVSIARKHKFLGLPFIRGIFSFIDSMVVGMRALTWSCSFFEDDEEAQPSRFEAWLDKVFGEKLESVLMSVVMVFSFVMAIGIFMVLPLLIALRDSDGHPGRRDQDCYFHWVYQAGIQDGGHKEDLHVPRFGTQVHQLH